uniref:Uncharacterized protein n=1 Tax=Strombidium inclinatum TaxID=197538 RepID=A0A7S3IYJ5_9SPIT
MRHSSVGQREEGLLRLDFVVEHLVGDINNLHQELLVLSIFLEIANFELDEAIAALSFVRNHFENLAFSEPITPPQQLPQRECLIEVCRIPAVWHSAREIRAVGVRFPASIESKYFCIKDHLLL